MKKVLRLLKGHNYICFLDFEGTQFSHEMIAYGAQLCKLDKQGRIKSRKEPIKFYVRAKNKIGGFVTKLTGITQADLDKKGIQFSTAMERLKKYCGVNFKKCSFVTFGNHDMRILNQSIAYNLDAPKDICSQIQKNYIDIQPTIAEFIRDENYNPMSLAHYLELFGIKEDGVAHDPEWDAVNLASLYDAFLTEKETVLNEYLKVLQRINSLPEPIKQAVKKLASGETVTGKEFENMAKEYID